MGTELVTVEARGAGAAFTRGPNDVEVVARCIGGNRGRLIFNRVPLDGRQPHVLGGALGEFACESRQLCATHGRGLCHRSTRSYTSALKFYAQNKGRCQRLFEGGDQSLSVRSAV